MAHPRRSRVTPSFNLLLFTSSSLVFKRSSPVEVSTDQEFPNLVRPTWRVSRHNTRNFQPTIQILFWRLSIAKTNKIMARPLRSSSPLTEYREDNLNAYFTFRYWNVETQFYFILLHSSLLFQSSILLKLRYRQAPSCVHVFTYSATFSFV